MHFCPNANNTLAIIFAPENDCSVLSSRPIKPKIWERWRSSTTCFSPWWPEDLMVMDIVWFSDLPVFLLRFVSQCSEWKHILLEKSAYFVFPLLYNLTRWQWQERCRKLGAYRVQLNIEVWDLGGWCFGCSCCARGAAKGASSPTSFKERTRPKTMRLSFLNFSFHQTIHSCFCINTF